jgi:hypothetical protein
MMTLEAGSIRQTRFKSGTGQNRRKTPISQWVLRGPADLNRTAVIAGLKGSDLSETPYWGMLFVSSAGIWGMPVNASQDKDRPAWPTKI